MINKSKFSGITLAEKEFKPFLQWDSVKARFSNPSLNSVRYIYENYALGCELSSKTGDLQENLSEETASTIKSEIEIPVVKGPVEYMEKILLPQIKPLMELTLLEAVEKGLFNNARSFIFNATNCLSHILLNIDPLHPGKKYSLLLETELGKKCQQPVRERRGIGTKYNYALDQMDRYKAVLIIQRQVRGWLVRKQEAVQELRQFWKALNQEKQPNTCLPIVSTDSNFATAPFVKY